LRLGASGKAYSSITEEFAKQENAACSAVTTYN